MTFRHRSNHQIELKVSIATRLDSHKLLMIFLYQSQDSKHELCFVNSGFCNVSVPTFILNYTVMAYVATIF
ncbi:Hypothetical predicted protein [Octopus vulgaris]|uniref:Uncharacterized protein n=1 Tax=Octopus vulgaris TaxID=6645 RepID=A0AA36FF98_OCTVU|nr:Hypothetical predicted protein [Octopus vulgaris]